MLYEFINSRVENDCIVGNLSKFIFNNQKSIEIIGDPLDIKASNFIELFNGYIFDGGRYLRITS